MSGKLVDTTLLHYFRTKLDTVFAKKSEVGDKNVIEHVQKNGTELTVNNKTVNVTVPTRTSELTNNSGFVTGDSIPTKTSQLTNDSGYITNSDVPTKTSQLTNDSDFVSDANYVHTDNNFTTQEKDKLNGIASGAEVNVQSNWDETDTSSDSFIQHKPTIPTATSQLNNDSNFVSDANYVHTDNNFTSQDKTKLESVEEGAQVNVIEKVQQNGVDLNIENKTVNVTVPTKTSELENDSDFVTSADIPEGGIVDTELSSTSTNPVQNKAIKQETDKILGNLATIETSPAIANHAIGDYIVYDSQLYKVTATITAGETITDKIESVYLADDKVSKSGDTMTGQLTMSGANIKIDHNKIVSVDSQNQEYPAIVDNGSNLWIGSQQTAYRHHAGGTYISAGWDTTTQKGNETIYVSVPNTANTGASNHLVLHDGMAKDYVIEQKNNASNGYTKWASGKLEQYGYTTHSTTINKGWGNGYRSDSTYSQTYPISFNAVYSTNINVYGGGEACWLGISHAGTATRTPWYYFIRSATLTTNTKFYVTYYAVGRWK